MVTLRYSVKNIWSALVCSELHSWRCYIMESREALLERVNSKEKTLNKFTQSMTLMGIVTEVRDFESSFKIKCRSGNEFLVYINSETYFAHLTNLNGLNLDRVPNPENFDWNRIQDRVRKYIKEGQLLSVYGNYIEEGERNRFDGRAIHLLQTADGERFLFEETHWWISQIESLANTWLESLFGNSDNYDFYRYTTNLDITGEPVGPDKDVVQECATLSRLIYGLSSAYMLTGCQRFLDAASQGVRYQREHFRSLSHDGKHCIWAFGKRHNNLIIPSENPDDRGSIPLYEQIYAIAGLTQYYRITQEWEVLEDIQRTVQAFDYFFKDNSEYGGYFSHIDYATLSPSSDALIDSDKNNKEKKNWNSIGDHIPAYLINLMLAIESLPELYNRISLKQFHSQCENILRETSTLILEKFPDPNPNIPFVNEKFYRDWTPDKTWRWQQNRAVVGHNLKIAWNLTRVACYYYDKDRNFSDRLMKFANKLGQDMAEIGIDQFRSGVYDVLEREPQSDFSLDFPWSNTKDFWQQEQGILAYQILYGYEKNPEYKQLAQELAAFWNLHYLDSDYKSIYFRTTENGMPIVRGTYGQKGGHSISGYHAFELNFLSHVYIRSYFREESLCLFFKPCKESGLKSINVLPDFFKQGALKMQRITINGADRTPTPDEERYNQVRLNDDQLGAEVVVELVPVKQSNQ